jgi:hypothetical protein
MVIQDIKISNNTLYLILCSFILINLYITNTIVITDEIIHDTFSLEISSEEIRQILLFKKKYGWISYVAQPMALLIKIYFTAGCLFMGLMIYDVRVKFSKILRTVLLGEFVFVIYTVFRLGFIYTKDFSSLEQIQKFWPLSLFSLFSSDSIPQWLFYPLYTINIAEIAYWLVLSLGLTYLIKTKFLQSLKTVLTSYGAGLLLWMVFLVFVQLYFLESV